MPDKLSHYRPNPAYGAGVARRRIRLVAGAGLVRADLYDDFHDMTVELRHDGVVVTGVDGAMRRYPKTTCPGAAAALDRLVGARIADGRAGMLRLADRREHCTHLLDLALLSLSMQARGETERLFEVAVADRTPEGRQTVAVWVDGAPSLSFAAVDEVIAEPAEWRGAALFGGFGRWAAERFAGLELDVWMVAQMAVLIAQGRAYLTDGPEPLPVAKGLHRKDACHTFSEPRFSQAWDCVGTVRDLTAGLPPLAGDGAA